MALGHRELVEVNTEYLLQLHDSAVGTDALMDAISVDVMAFIEDFCVLVNGIGAVRQGRHFCLLLEPGAMGTVVGRWNTVNWGI